MESLAGFFASIWTSLKTVLTWLIDGIKYVSLSVLYYIYDGLLTVVQSIIGSLDVGTLVTSTAGVWAGLSPQSIWLINATGVPTGLSIILYAIIIRKTLDLIPAVFTRF